jgi:hypothetical protein
MLTFASPEDTPDLYRKIENVNIPHKLLFDGKFAEIKWYLKTNKQDSFSMQRHLNSPTLHYLCNKLSLKEIMNKYGRIIT